MTVAARLISLDGGSVRIRRCLACTPDTGVRCWRTRTVVLASAHTNLRGDR
jgi:hypothetical protein